MLPSIPHLATRVPDAASATVGPSQELHNSEQGNYLMENRLIKGSTMSAKISIVFAIALLLFAAGRAEAQQWQPSTTQMPAMPEMSELSGDWLGPRADWFRGVAEVSGVQPSQLRAVGEPSRGGSTQVVRFNSGPVPVVVWQDRNGDGTADIIEIYRSGGVVIQVIDADYDRRANVVRVYDASGALSREERL